MIILVIAHDYSLLLAVLSKSVIQESLDHKETTNIYEYFLFKD